MSGNASPDPQTFYTQDLPGQWNRNLDEQERLGEEGREVCEGMKAVNATIRVDLLDTDVSYFLNIEGGRMKAGDCAAHPPFLTLRQNDAAYEQISSGSTTGSPMAVLGGLAGLGLEMRLTQQRIDDLADVSGLLKLIVRGDDGFDLYTHFGTEPIPEEPTAAVVLDADTYHDLRSGELHPQQAFMNDQIQIEGDMDMVFQLALAVMAPD
jgi:hypothetical protein